MELFVCPYCEGDLLIVPSDEPELKSESDYYCPHCNLRFYVVGGVPIFTVLDHLGWVGLDAAYRIHQRDQLKIPFEVFFDIINRYSSPAIKDLETLLHLAIGECCTTAQQLNNINSMNPYYSQLYETTCLPIYVWITQKVANLFDINNSSILDIGVGGGRLELFLAEKLPQSQIFGVDIDFPLCVRCKHHMAEHGHNNTHIVCADIMSMPLADKAIDFIVSSGGLSHIEGLNPALKELSRVLKPGGYFICAEFERPITSPVSAEYLSAVDRSNGLFDVKQRLQTAGYMLISESINIGNDPDNPQHGLVFQKPYLG